MSIDPFTHPRWYAIQTRSWYEKRVRDQLTAQAIVTFLPLWQKRSRWTDRVRLIELPLFPGYLFGYFTLQQKVEVLTPVGVTRLVSFNGEPVPIPEEQIEVVRTLVTHQLRYDPHPYLVEGMQVRITHGPLAGTEGILVLKKSAARLIIRIELIQRAVAVDIDSTAVEALGWDPMSHSPSHKALI
jgi:transcription termination/antitermination protein NusG